MTREGAGSVRVPAAIAAVLLPPLGVFLDRGIGRDFWVTVGLTCLFFIPGVVFALWSLFGHAH